ncbi:MAG: hypothetical protein U0401_29550 [Anaerolineae bacterium]
MRAVPTQAIQTEQIDGQTVTYVEKLDGQGNIIRVEIETGLRSGSVTQVLAGLEEGDQVIIRQQTKAGSSSKYVSKKSKYSFA